MSRTRGEHKNSGADVSRAARTRMSGGRHRDSEVKKRERQAVAQDKKAKRLAKRQAKRIAKQQGQG